MILTGALVNGIAIVAGGLAGTFGGKVMPERMKQTLLTASRPARYGHRHLRSVIQQ